MRALCCSIFFSIIIAEHLGAQVRSSLLDAQFESNDLRLKDSVLLEIEQSLKRLGIKNLEPIASSRSRLIVRNPRKKQDEALREEQGRRLVELQKQVEKGRLLYFDSRFKEAATQMRGVFPSLDSVALVLDESTVRTCLSYWAAATFFDGNETEARTVLRIWLSLDPTASLSPDRFPPPVVNLLSNIKSEALPSRRKVSLSSNSMGFEARILGFRFPVVGSNPVNLELPSLPSPLEDKTLVLERAKAAPIFHRPGQVPSSIQFESLEDQQLSTSGLFGVIYERTPPRALIELLTKLQIDVTLLLDITQDLQRIWVLRAQWLDARTLQRSAVFQVEERDPFLASRALAAKLANGRTADGGVKPIPASIAKAVPQIQAEQRFYNTWWFWTAVGAGVLGAGLGTYFVLSAKDQQIFSVREAQ